MNTKKQNEILRKKEDEIIALEIEMEEKREEEAAKKGGLLL